MDSRFQINRSKPLGGGVFGFVYGGYDSQTKEQIAVKFIKNSILDDMPNYQREIETMKDLTKQNRNDIMKYYGHQIKEDGLYIYVEYCKGGSLQDLIFNKKANYDVLLLFKQLLQVMTYLHEQKKIIHRDLKPDNILLSEDHQQIKLADFGQSRVKGVQMTSNKGADFYRAPQASTSNINQSKMIQYGQKCDVWSAGVILYKMLVRKTAGQILKQNPQLPKVSNYKNAAQILKFPPQISEWKNVVEVMLTCNPNKRPSFKKLKQYFLTKDKLGSRKVSETEKQRNSLIAPLYSYKDKDQIQNLKKISLNAWNMFNTNNWVDQSSFDYKNLGFNGYKITNKGYRWANVIGKNVIAGCYKFSVTINEMNRYIGIGVIDQTLRNSSGISYLSGDINFTYYSDGDCISGNKYSRKMGQGYELGETVVVTVDVQAGTIKWEVDNNIRYSITNNQLLKKLDIKFVPFISMQSPNDSVCVSEK